jgi:hypothetical protein
MRTILSVAAAAAAICAMSSLAMAESMHYSGGPLQEGNMCWVSYSNDLGYGFWKACEMAPHAMHHKKK